MPALDGVLRWAPKVPRSKVRRLYETDARGILDPELIDAVGWALWERCDSILTVTAAHHGHVRCPACSTTIECQDHWSVGENIVCGACGWQMPWATYHQSYRGKQLFGANAVTDFEIYSKDFPKAQTAQAKMLLIDQLIHAFHIGLSDIGRPAGANLIEGTLKEVIQFLDALTSGPTSAAGVANSQPAWHETLLKASWTSIFIRGDENSTPKESV